MAVVAQLFADRTRAAVVAALLDGRALTAGELARAGEVSAPTVSAHLSRLLAAGLVAVQAQGRHRYYRLADERSARAFEALAALAPVRPIRSLRQSRVAAELAWARTCYDHLAGAVAVSLTDTLIQRQVLTEADGRYQPGPESHVLESFGLDLGDLSNSRRSFAHPCLDWSERRHHIAGALGAGLLSHMATLGWVRRRPASRAVVVNDTGRQGLAEAFGWRPPAQPGQQGAA